MIFEHSIHWKKQKKFRPEITDDLIELCITNSDKLNDRIWDDVFNAIAKIPPSGRKLKVIYRDKGKVIKILTAYWIN